MRPSYARISALFLTIEATLAATALGGQPVRAKVDEAWKPIVSAQPAGLLGERLKLWREHRLWRVGNDSFLLSGFESRPGSHSYQGEFVGKWLHAAVLAYEATRDPKLLKLMEDTVDRLIRCQEANGYLGTYAPSMRFYVPMAPQEKSWDVWAHRYNIYGLLVYDQFHHDPDAVQTCVRMADLLIETFGPGRRPITAIGYCHGMSSATIIESVMMLYQRTGERRFLDFAEHVVETSEDTPGFKLLSAMLAGQDVSGPGDGKAYQLMANLLGYLEIYRYTDDPRYLKAALNAWESIRTGHIYETGGPWGYNSPPPPPWRLCQSTENFAEPLFFDPTNDVETCSTTTWVQLCLLLQRLTGQAKYGSEAERAMLNHLIGAQSPNGNDWAYYTRPNCKRRLYEDKITCCASSGPRALEMYARQLAGFTGGSLSLTGYLPASISVSGGPGALKNLQELTINGNYPFENRATIRFGLSAPADFAVDFPVPAGAKSLVVRVNGKVQTTHAVPSGHLRLQRRWRADDVVEVRMDFPVMAWLHTGRDSKRWVAFTRGPFTLAEEVQNEGGVPPVFPSANPSGGLEPADRKTVPSYRIRGTDAILVPYYLAGSTGQGVRTYFQIGTP